MSTSSLSESSSASFFFENETSKKIQLRKRNVHQYLDELETFKLCNT
ncbi:8049_t:CDS:1, partial [Cetraspora pellucida]